MRGTWAAAKAAVLGPIRRRGRVILWTRPGVNFGNYCYRWMRAATRRRAGGDDRVLLLDVVVPWLEVFPALRELSIRRRDVRWTDARTYDLGYSRFGTDFGPVELDAFVRDYLLTGRLALTPGDPRHLVVNVRRGDYYSEPALTALYGFDQTSYVRAAVERSLAIHGPLTSITVVSDGLDWCRRHLGWLDDVAEVRFGARTDTPAGHLAEVASSRRLVITNSTFSYWGAYVSSVLHGDNHAGIIAPSFHRRDLHDGRAWQLDERWSVLDVAPLPDDPGSGSGTDRPA